MMCNEISVSAVLFTAPPTGAQEKWKNVHVDGVDCLSDMIAFQRVLW